MMTNEDSSSGKCVVMRLKTRVKHWQIIAHNLKKRGWSLGWVSALDSEGRKIWIANAHRDGKRFVVGADDLLTGFLELGTAVGTYWTLA
jgi:hypothetical protein